MRKRSLQRLLKLSVLTSGILIALISHDHMGSFASALGGVNTPETQQADCDLALGRLVEAVANSRYAADTLVIVTEDDGRDGGYGVDASLPSPGLARSAPRDAGNGRV